GNGNEPGLEFITMIKGGVIPTEFIPSVEKDSESYGTRSIERISFRKHENTLLDGSFTLRTLQPLTLKCCERRI
ncbi:hypothetical protein, partial [Chryseobacterium gleum]|uniref:hypothetical protein n=1 Tax=Chryseobacterium gleum TaxID=250 RepID=UPI00192CD75F